jgi:hypothetical protein
VTGFRKRDPPRRRPNAKEASGPKKLMYDSAAHHRLLPRIPRCGATPHVDQCRTEQCELGHQRNDPDPLTSAEVVPVPRRHRGPHLPSIEATRARFANSSSIGAIKPTHETQIETGVVGKGADGVASAEGHNAGPFDGLLHEPWRHDVQLACVVSPGRSGGSGGVIHPCCRLERDDFGASERRAHS